MEKAVESPREIAERRVRAEQEAAHEEQVRAYEAEETARREEERREAEAETRRAAAKELDEALIPEHARVIAELEKAAAELARKVEEYLTIRQRREEARRAAGLFVPSGTARDDVGGYLNREVGPYVSPFDTHIANGRPSLPQRDGLLVNDEGGRG